MGTSVREMTADSCSNFCNNSVVYIPPTLFLSSPVIIYSAPSPTFLNVLILNFCLLIKGSSISTFEEKK